MRLPSWSGNALLMKAYPSSGQGCLNVSRGLSLATTHRMNLLGRALFCLLLLAAARSGSAQDKILLMNGELIQAKVIGQSTLEVRYLETRKNGSVRERAEPTEEVFSVTDSLGRERIWYFYDTVFGNDLNIEQMRWFLKGEQDARTGYKPIWPMIGSFAAGAGLVIGLNWEMNSLFVPPITAGIMAAPRVHVTRGSVTDLTMEGNPYYATGYARVGRSKRVVRCLIASFVGIGVGLAVRQLVINPTLDYE